MKKGVHIIERFDGITSFLKTINSRKPNTVFCSGSLSSEKSDSSFTLTSSYEQSVSIMESGYIEGLEGLKKEKGTKFTAQANRYKNVPVNQVVGFAPHVPNAIIGIPEQMIATRNVKTKSKVITIYYDGGAEGGMDAHEFVKAGRNLLDTIIMLELQGYRVELYIIDSYCKSDQKGIFFLKVKDHRQPINPLKVSYILLHPSFFRRQGFRWLETCPEITDKGFRHGYGTPMRYSNNYGQSTDCVRRYLKTNGLIGEDDFFTDLYEARNTAPADLVVRMGIKK